MTQQFDDIDALIGRLKALARQQERQASTQPPAFAYREQLGALLQPDADPAQVRDPQRPQFEELVAANHSDELFLRRAYLALMGRAVDSDGLTHYLGVLPRAGRLYVLAELLCADEARDYLARQGVTVPRRGRLTLPFRLVGRLGPLGRLLRPPMRLAYRLAAILLRPKLRLLERVSMLEAQANSHGDLVRDVLLELDGELSRHGGELQQLSQRGAAHEQQLAEHDRMQPALWSALQQQRRTVERLAAGERGELNALPEQSQLLDQSLMDVYYLAFEDACRGSEAEIRTHLLNYQPQLDAASAAGTRALDLGSGRGEWLALLKERGFEPHGADLNIAMVEHTRQQGLTVAHADAIAVLRDQPDNSHALVSGFHIAEHMPFAALYRLVDEAQRILAPGGVLILETPNPENLLVGSHTFYHDPTHRNPLTPTAMQFLLGYHGFAEVEVRRFNPYPESAKVPGDDALTERVNGHLCGPQDFAVIGRKAAPAVADDADQHQEGDT